MSDALDHFEALMSDVDNLIAHHPKFIEPLRGHPATDEGPLLRSCIVLIYAAWEVYFEDSLIKAAGALAQRDRVDIPEQTLAWLGERVADDPWRLADNGWRVALVEAVTELVRGREDDALSFGVNTASPGTVSTLQYNVLGDSILERCTWSAPGRSTSKGVKDALMRLVRLRGEIAHNGRPAGPLHLRHVRDWRKFIRRLAEKHDEQLSLWLFGNANALIRSI